MATLIAPAESKQPQRNHRARSDFGWLLFFLLPGLGGLLIFTVLPILASLVLTLFDLSLIHI